jgi:hypothetical protein
MSPAGCFLTRRLWFTQGAHKMVQAVFHNRLAACVYIGIEAEFSAAQAKEF